MEKITIGIEKRISLGVLELALRSVLDGSASSDYFYELANTECTGANRAKKIVAVINRLTIKGKLTPFLKEHKEDVLQALRNKNDRAMIFVSMMCSSYTIFYDAVSIFGKFFHVQEQVSREFLLKKLAEKYGSKRALDVAFDCIVPMLMEAGFISRPKPGIYEMYKQDKYTEFAKTVFKQSFIINNPTFAESDVIESNPYFEFV